MRKLLVAALLCPLFAYAAVVEGPAPGETRAGVNNAANVSDGKLWVQDDATDGDAGATVVEQGQFDYETVAASQTDQVLGVTGATGDFLHKLVIVVSTAATAATSIKDGSGSAISVLPNSPGGGIGVYEVEFNMVSTGGAWKVTTGAGASVIAVGRFTP